MPLLARSAASPTAFRTATTRLLHHHHHRTFASASPSPPTINALTYPAPHGGHIRILLLNRPSTRNALSRQLISELSTHIRSIHSEGPHSSTRALILGSETASAFSAGADLKERRSMNDSETRSFLSDLRSTLRDLSHLPIPTVAAVHAVALGGGLELALAARFRVLASTAQVGLPETRLAIVPGAGGTYRLPALIGRQRARDLILTGRRVGGPEAYFLGLADRLVEVKVDEGEDARERVLREAIQLATTICEGGPVAVAAALEALDAPNGVEEGEKEAEARENRLYERVLATEDRMEALRAFAEKRAPIYKGC